MATKSCRLFQKHSLTTSIKVRLKTLWTNQLIILYSIHDILFTLVSRRQSINIQYFNTQQVVVIVSLKVWTAQFSQWTLQSVQTWDFNKQTFWGERLIHLLQVNMLTGKGNNNNRLLFLKCNKESSQELLQILFSSKTLKNARFLVGICSERLTIALYYKLMKSSLALYKPSSVKDAEWLMTLSLNFL